MKLLEFTVERDDASGGFTAWWDDPDGGGITTQAYSLAKLPDAINEAVRCHFSIENRRTRSLYDSSYQLT